ncbi:UNVERIFIED_CONTAM: hypothetical protein ABID98_004292 [Brevibacillus sp. OAP136]
MQFFLALCLLFSPLESVAAEQVELFDTEQERVVQTFTNSSAFQEEALHILDSVTGRVLELSPSLEHALIVKIPLAPPKSLVVPAAKIDEKVLSVFVIIPKQQNRKPWLIVHTKKEETLLLEFTAGIARLRQLIGKPS